MSSRIEPRSAPILASGSPYRRELLHRIVPDAEAISPGIDEHVLPREAPSAAARRLARAKAEAVTAAWPRRIIIGSDQIAELGGRALGKPGHRAAALAQLKACSGHEVVFHTAVVVLDGWGGGDEHLDRTVVRFRPLREIEIERYLDTEQPYDCAGSFKAEGLGICLFEAIECADPSALIGLPLIATCRLLRAAGFDPLMRSEQTKALFGQ